jgi:ribonuclease G
MSESLLINVTPQETRVALIFQGAVQELHIERTLSRGLVGNIYLGKVVRVLPGMQSAFIDIGLERAAFLHVADIWDARPQGHEGNPNNVPLTPIEKLLFDGQAITVQVVKDPIGTKGARLSTQISIAGRMLVFLPQDSHIGISQRIENEEEREALRTKVQGLMLEDEKGGFIVRTMAEDASEEDLRTDIEYLRRTWSTITKLTKTKPPCSLLHQDLNLAQRKFFDATRVRTHLHTVGFTQAPALHRRASTV